MSKILQAGLMAPEFCLHVTPDQTLSLSELKGKPVILAFYPADFSPVCSDELSLFNELLSEFHKYKAAMIGISVDSSWCHSAFAKSSHLHFPLMSDFQPKGDVSKRYGVFNEKQGTCERALFVIDKEGKIVWSFLSPVGENPGADGILDALENLLKD